MIRIEIIGEIEVSTENYPTKMTNEEIKEFESEYWHEWIEDHVISKKITITDKKQKKIKIMKYFEKLIFLKKS